MKPSSTEDPPVKTARDRELEHYRRIQEDGKLLAEAFRDLEAREREPHWPVCFRVAADMLERARAKGCRYWTGPVLRRKKATLEDQAEQKPVHRTVEVPRDSH
jgi:hypothetical protein